MPLGIASPDDEDDSIHERGQDQVVGDGQDRSRVEEDKVCVAGEEFENAAKLRNGQKDSGLGRSGGACRQEHEALPDALARPRPGHVAREHVRQAGLRGASKPPMQRRPAEIGINQDETTPQLPEHPGQVQDDRGLSFLRPRAGQHDGLKLARAVERLKGGPDGATSFNWQRVGDRAIDEVQRLSLDTGRRLMAGDRWQPPQHGKPRRVEDVVLGLDGLVEVFDDAGHAHAQAKPEQNPQEDDLFRWRVVGPQRQGGAIDHAETPILALFLDPGGAELLAERGVEGAVRLHSSQDFRGLPLLRAQRR